MNHFQILLRCIHKDTILLLAGGDKSSQASDILKARQLAKEMKEKLIPFDMATLLDSDEAISEYLSQVLADGDSDEIIRALGHIARARGMSKIAADSGLGRESLYKALTPGAKPRFDTVLRVVRALGIDLLARPHFVSR